MKIEDLGLSARAYNVLKRVRIDTVEQLQQLSDEELLNFRNMGTTTVKEIREKVAYVKTMTIADRMRAMSNNEELAKFLLSPADFCKMCDTLDFCTGYPDCNDSRCIDAVIKYLQQPAEEGHHE